MNSIHNMPTGHNKRIRISQRLWEMEMDGNGYMVKDDYLFPIGLLNCQINLISKALYDV